MYLWWCDDLDCTTPPDIYDSNNSDQDHGAHHHHQALHWRHYNRSHCNTIIIILNWTMQLSQRDPPTSNAPIWFNTYKWNEMYITYTIDCVRIWNFEFKKLAIAFSCQKSWFRRDVISIFARDWVSDLRYLVRECL